MKKHGRFLTCILAAMLLMNVPVFAAEEKAEIRYGEPYSYGVMLEAAYTERSLTTMEDGKPIAVVGVSTSDDTIIQVIDLNSERIIHKFHLATGGGTYGYMYYGTVDQNGVCWMTLGKHVAYYDPNTKEAKLIGAAPTTKSGNLYQLTHDPETGTIYGVTGNYARVFSCDPNSGKITTVFTIPGCKTSEGIAVLGNYLYASGKVSNTATEQTYLYRIDKNNGDAVALPLPDGVSKFTSGSYVYSGGKYVIARMSTPEGTFAYVWDTQAEKWTDTVFKYYTSGMSDMDDENRYWFLNDGYFHSIDMDTLEIVDYPDFKYSSHLRGNGRFVELEDQEQFPGKSFVTAQYSGNLYIFNPEKQTTTQVNVTLQGGSLEKRIARMGDDGRIYACAFKGSSGAALNPTNGEIEYFKCEQGEGITSANGKVYVGYYSGAYILELDTARPLNQSGKTEESNPRTLFSLKDDYGQDRPFGMDVAGDYLLIGTLPTASNVGGALTVMDINTREYVVYDDEALDIKDQAILTITHKDNMVYFGTTITGGNGSTPTTNVAQVVAFDLETRQVVKKVEISIPGVSVQIGGVHGLRIGPDGDLYGTGKSFDFVMDPETLEVKRSNVFGSNFDKNNGYGTQIWHETYMEFDERTGYLFRAGTILDPETLKTVVAAPDLGQFVGLDDSGNAYFYGSNTEVYRVPVIYGDDKSYLVSSLNFFTLGSGDYYKGGQRIPAGIYEDNGRIMVPVRAFTTMLGGTVGYDEETETVTLTAPSGDVITFSLNNDILFVNGIAKKLGVVAMEKDGVSYLPLYSLTQFLNASVTEQEGIYFLGREEPVDGETLSYIQSML